MQPNRAAVYCRISRDPSGQALGVARQQSDCIEKARSLGWPVADLLIDNDTSAYSGKPRPEYQRLLVGLRDGTYDAVIAWHPDRLHRHPRELEEFIDAVEAAKAPVVTVQAGELDLGTASGRMVARIIGAMARGESEHKSARLRRKHQELAEKGMRSGGGRRAYGFEPDGITHRPAEAEEIRQAMQKLLSGASLRSITLDWQRRLETSTGAAWSPTTVKRLLTSMRIAGYREHRGVATQAVWEPIVTREDVLRARALLKERQRTQGTQPRKYPLTGLVHCGACGQPMTSKPVRRKGHLYPRYACSADRGGCGKVGIAGAPLDAYVIEQLTNSTLVTVIPWEPDPQPHVDLSAIEDRRNELARQYAQGALDMASWQMALVALDEEQRKAEMAVTERKPFTRTGPATWRLHMALQQAGVRLKAAQDDPVALAEEIGGYVERITVAPTTRANNRFDPDRIEITMQPGCQLSHA